MLKFTMFVLAASLASPALASGTHAGGHHGEEADAMAVVKPGKRKDASKTIRVTMKETADGDMLFEPAKVSVRKGQTVRFIVSNAGELDHEFVLDEHESLIKHKALMEKFPEMEHDDPNAVRLEPGKKGEIIWTFTNGGQFEFACLIPGHYEAGMRGDLTVTGK